MAQSVVLQMQELASDSSKPLIDLLHIALIVSTKLNLQDLRQWVLAEINGYEESASLPPYRVISGDLKVHNPYRGLIPFLIQEPDLQEAACRIALRDSVSSIQSLVTQSKNGTVVYYFDPEKETALMRLQSDSFGPLRPLRVVGANQLLSILQTVRTTVLEWALRLEAEGIRGDGIIFTNSEKERAMTRRSIHIENFQGVLGDVHGSTVSQTNTIAVSAGNFDTLATYLASLGVVKLDIDELQRAIQSDPGISKDKKFGTSVSAWIGKMISRAASGSWDISVATAGTVLGAALAKFYGF